MTSVRRIGSLRVVAHETLSEADTRAKMIDPALHGRGWTEDLIRREEMAATVDIIDGKPRRRARGRTDYVLRIKVNPDNQPVAVAVIEAKASNLPPAHGLDQAKGYAACKRLNVPFAFSSNGRLFVEFDRWTGLTSKPRPTAEFPSPAELRARYEKGMGFSLEDDEARPLLMRYLGGEATRRYYQDAAIRAALEKIARCRKENKPPRVLLALATGAGKTFIAVHLLKRMADAGQVRRALFVCDRDELRLQGIGAFQNVFGADAAEVFENSDGANNAKNARIHVATYQTLNVASPEDSALFLERHYPPGYFSHIVIDECHRSAWGKWSVILERNPEAVQVGLTATPREIEITEGNREAIEDREICADNIKHFGEPVYAYDLAQGIDDGYLAACEILRYDLFHENKDVNERESGVSREDLAGKELRDALTGEALGEEFLRERYVAGEIEDRLLMPGRVEAMARHLFDRLVEAGSPEEKTIIFCRRDRHAQDVAIEMNNLYAVWCREKGRIRLDPYAFRCTAAGGGSDYLPDLKGSNRSHFVATTVDLLTTGVDVPAVRNIVFFKYVRSPIAFYQMVGRGSRIDTATNKLMFRIYDYTDATRLFGQAFLSRRTTPSKGEETGPPLPLVPTIQVEGIEVRVTDAGRYIVTMKDGRAMPVTVEEYKERLAERLVAEAPTVERFREVWVRPSERRELIDRLPDAGRSAAIIRKIEEMEAYDLFDVLAELGYGLAPKTRAARADAFSYKHGSWLSTLPASTAATLKALTAQFGRGGTDEIENPAVFQTPEVVRAGGLAALRDLGQPAEILREAKNRIFAA